MMLLSSQHFSQQACDTGPDPMGTSMINVKLLWTALESKEVQENDSICLHQKQPFISDRAWTFLLLHPCINL